MKTRHPDLGSYIRRLVWAAPVLAAWQPGIFGCELKSSCSDFRSERIDDRVLLDSSDGGTAPSTPEQCQTFCHEHAPGGFDYACRNETGDAGQIVVCSYNTACTGRCPAGFEPPVLDPRAPLLGRYFAALAAAEAASVVAFEQLAHELEQHGLPADLARRARRAATDEERHYRMAAALARKFGAAARRGTVSLSRGRSLFELAVDNVREGLVVETLGAAFGWWQAAHASEHSVRQAMERIAADETEHAELSWDVDAALRARLSPGQRAELDAATAEALASFEKEIGAPPPEELIARAGLPSRQVAMTMFAEARRVLYS